MQKGHRKSVAFTVYDYEHFLCFCVLLWTLTPPHANRQQFFDSVFCN